MAYASRALPMDDVYGMEHNEFWSDTLQDYDRDRISAEQKDAARDTVQRLLVEALPVYVATYATETAFMDAVDADAKLGAGLDRYLTLAMLYHYFASASANPSGRDAVKAETYYRQLTAGVRSWAAAVQSATQSASSVVRRSPSIWITGRPSWGTAPN